MCGPANERHPVPGAGEHGAIKAANGACANNCNVVKGGCIQVVSRQCKIKRQMLGERRMF